METNLNKYCIILAGGKGRRLWPSSRETWPKQFLDFFGVGRTQLQSTFDRFSKILPIENIIVTTIDDYADLVREQLPNLCADNLVVEPVIRNTAPSVAYAVLLVLRRCPDATVVIAPSDQIVLDEQAYAQNILEGLRIVADRDTILTMGVRPTRPEPGYGYIQMGDPAGPDDTYHVRSFTEKPERDFAKIFVESGEFLWNTGMFLGKASHINHSCARFFPEVASQISEMPGGLTLENDWAFITRNYASYPNLSIDYGVLERCDDVCVMECDFGWADLGTWHSVYESKQRGENDNVVIDSEVMMENCKDNVIKLSKGKLGVFNGLDGYIVAEHSNVLLICKKGDTSGLMRKYVNEVQLKYGDEYV